MSADLEQRVADALENSDAKKDGYSRLDRAYYDRLARAAIAAVFDALEVTDEMCIAYKTAWDTRNPKAPMYLFEARGELEAALIALKGEL